MHLAVLGTGVDLFSLALLIQLAVGQICPAERNYVRVDAELQPLQRPLNAVRFSRAVRAQPEADHGDPPVAAAGHEGLTCVQGLGSSKQADQCCPEKSAVLQKYAQSSVVRSDILRCQVTSAPDLTHPESAPRT